MGLTHPPAMETASSDGKMYHAHKHLGNVGTRDRQRPPPLMETASSDGKMYYACMHTSEMSEREICKGHLPSWKRHLLMTAKCPLTARVGNETCQVCQKTRPCDGISIGEYNMFCEAKLRWPYKIWSIFSIVWKRCLFWLIRQE